MDTKKIKELIDYFLEKKELRELNVKEDNISVFFSKNETPSINNTPLNSNNTIRLNNSVLLQKEKKDTNIYIVKSPIVGIFYTKPSPEEKEFVNIGDEVDEGDILCILEAMKVFSNIETEKKGKIIEILVEDSTYVEYNQPLFKIQLN